MSCGAVSQGGPLTRGPLTQPLAAAALSHTPAYPFSPWYFSRDLGPLHGGGAALHPPLCHISLGNHCSEPVGATPVSFP